MKELEASIPVYIKKIGNFMWKNKSWHITDHYRIPDNQSLIQCQVCEKAWIREVFEITNVEGKTIVVGNECIYNVTNEKIGAYYKNYSRHKENLIKNKVVLHNIDVIIKTWSNCYYRFHYERKDYEKFKKMLKRLCIGLNLTKTQQETYMRYHEKLPKLDIKNVTEDD